VKDLHGFKIRQFGGNDCLSMSMGYVCDPRTGARGEVVAYFTSVGEEPIIVTNVEYDTWEYNTEEKET